MSERRNVPEIVIGIRELLRRSQTRIDLLFTMSDIPHAHPAKDDACEVMFRGRDLGKRIVERWSARLRSARLRSARLRPSGYDVAAFARMGLPSRSWRSQRRLVEPDGIEPTTSCLQSTRSPS